MVVWFKWNLFSSTFTWCYLFSIVALTFELVDEILWCDHSFETSSALLSHGATCVLVVYKLKFGNFVKFWLWPLLGVKGLKYWCMLWFSDEGGLGGRTRSLDSLEPEDEEEIPIKRKKSRPLEESVDPGKKSEKLKRRQHVEKQSSEGAFHILYAYL